MRVLWSHCRALLIAWNFKNQFKNHIYEGIEPVKSTDHEAGMTDSTSAEV
jgi:hypothetical protein